MHVKIEVTRGPAAGYRVEVSPESPLLVGRAPGVGLCIPDDPTISRHHCQIDVTPPNCHLTSLSSNGTFVNGNPVTDIMLMHGDEISIGTDSVFTVHLVEDYAVQVPTVLQPKPDTKPPAERPTYFEEDCASGLTMFTPAGELPDAWEMTQRLLERGRVHAIVDFKRFGMAAPASVTRDAMLFDWFPKESPPESSPLVMEVNARVFEPLFQKGWDTDAIVLLVSQLEPAAMLMHLRSALTFNPQGKPQANPSGLLGICWPSILQQLLVHRPAEFVEGLLAGIDGVLVAAPDTPANWQILAPAAFSATLKELGLEKSRQSKAKKNKK